jgi:hypothetical protein
VERCRWRRQADESVDGLYQIGASPDHCLGSGRIGEVIWIVDASSNLFGLNGAIEVVDGTIKISNYALDLRNYSACGSRLKFRLTSGLLGLAKRELMIAGHWPS